VNEILDWILATVQSVDPVVRVLLAGFAMFCETSVLLGIVVPGDTVVLVSSTAVRGPVEYFALVVAVIAGALAGETVGFFLGRYFGPKIRRSRLGQRIGEPHWVRAETYLERRGGLAVFISRFLPVLHSLVPLVVGTSAMRYRIFMAWTVPACVLWAFAYVSVGSFAAGSYRELSGELHWAGFAFVGAVAAFLVVAYFVKKLLERREARHMRHPHADTDANV
jgi:membrane-associated protein